VEPDPQPARGTDPLPSERGVGGGVGGGGCGGGGGGGGGWEVTGKGGESSFSFGGDMWHEKEEGHTRP